MGDKNRNKKHKKDSISLGR